MNRDLRDPRLLGEEILKFKEVLPDEPARFWVLTKVPDYSDNLGPIEKYGYPQRLPSTLPN